MNSSKLNTWLSLIANIGVVVGLFVLIAEVNHASKLAEVEAYQTRIRDIQELNLQLALPDSLAGIQRNSTVRYWPIDVLRSSLFESLLVHSWILN